MRFERDAMEVREDGKSLLRESGGLGERFGSRLHAGRDGCQALRRRPDPQRRG